MKLIDRFFGWIPGFTARAMTQSGSGGRQINTWEELRELILGGTSTASGQTVTPTSSMRVAAVYACVRLISGAVATLPLQFKKRVDAKTREDASDDPLARVMNRRPNRWQTPSQFRRMQTAHLILRGNAYGLIVRSRGKVLEIIPMHPDQVKVDQLPTLDLVYTYTRADGRKAVFPQSEIMHLVVLTLDGVHGVSPITYARETIGLTLAQEEHGANTFKNGARISNVLSHPNKLGPEGLKFLQASLQAFRAGGENEGKDLVLEEGMKVEPLSMTAEDAQWIESRKFSRSEIAMFLGVPPHMIGDTEKSTSWGTGIEQQAMGFVAYTLEDYLTTWEESTDRDLIADVNSNLYAKFNRSALIRSDMKTRYAAYAVALQWGFKSPNEVRALEDDNPREDGEGDKYYDPPNTAGGKPQEDVPLESSQAA